ncbi:hypothetical protein OIV83_003052 [Microbotryomycetes sp. JL201]|nr:hypothetical protein OIV83_003052 [Microbotryomycetes sp. JL201]
MIPVRRQHKADHQNNVKYESVQAKLARLRSEHRRSDRRLRGERPALGDTRGYERQSHALTALMSSLSISRAHIGVERASSSAGPPPPKSWTAEPADATVFTKVNVQGQTVSKRELVRSLCAGPEDDLRIASLKDTVAQVVAFDLKQKPSKSLLLPYVHLLPAHVRIGLFDVAALSWPLEFGVMLELLREEDCEHTLLDPEEEDQESDDEQWDNQSSVHQVDRVAHWPSSTQARVSTLLTTLNLAFSSITTSQLRSMLVTGSLTTLRPVARFPNLANLSLCATTHVTFSETFFKTLASIISLRSLSLAGTNVNVAMLPVTQVLSRLASATPTLVKLDLSFSLFSQDCSLIESVDWSTRWLELEVLGLRTVGERSTRTDAHVRQIVLAGRSGSSQARKRPWIDVVV